MSEVVSPVIIYAESTPNPNAMMFVANNNLVGPDVILEFEDASKASVSPLAAALFKFPFIVSVFITKNVITLTKSDASVNWNALVLEMREFIKEFLSNNGEVYTGESISSGSSSDNDSKKEEIRSAGHKSASSETEQKIIDVLEEYIRPAVEGDGGAIHFVGFEAGVVTVKLLGACSGCPSSTITLKAGIEALLKRMVPEVTEVVAESA